MTTTYLTTDELAKRIKYECRTIREKLKDTVFLEGTHYIRPFGRKKILYDWEAIQRDMTTPSLNARRSRHETASHEKLPAFTL